MEIDIQMPVSAFANCAASSDERCPEDFSNADSVDPCDQNLCRDLVKPGEKFTSVTSKLMKGSGASCDKPSEKTAPAKFEIRATCFTPPVADFVTGDFNTAKHGPLSSHKKSSFTTSDTEKHMRRLGVNKRKPQVLRRAPAGDSVEEWASVAEQHSSPSSDATGHVDVIGVGMVPRRKRSAVLHSDTSEDNKGMAADSELTTQHQPPLTLQQLFQSANDDNDARGEESEAAAGRLERSQRCVDCGGQFTSLRGLDRCSNCYQWIYKKRRMSMELCQREQSDSSFTHFNIAAGQLPRGPLAYGSSPAKHVHYAAAKEQQQQQQHSNLAAECIQKIALTISRHEQQGMFHGSCVSELEQLLVEYKQRQYNQQMYPPSPQRVPSVSMSLDAAGRQSPLSMQREMNHSQQLQSSFQEAVHRSRLAMVEGYPYSHVDTLGQLAGVATSMLKTDMPLSRHESGTSLDMRMSSRINSMQRSSSLCNDSMRTTEYTDDVEQDVDDDDELPSPPQRSGGSSKAQVVNKSASMKSGRNAKVMLDVDPNWRDQPGVCRPDARKRGSSRKRLRQIEVLLAMTLLKEGDQLFYRSKSGKVMAAGTVKGNGIFCHRCHQIVGCTEFERCAGSGLRRPCDNIFTGDSTSLQDLLQKADRMMLTGAKAIGASLSSAAAGHAGSLTPAPLGAHPGVHWPIC